MRTTVTLLLVLALSFSAAAQKLTLFHVTGEVKIETSANKWKAAQANDVLCNTCRIEIKKGTALVVDETGKHTLIKTSGYHHHADLAKLISIQTPSLLSNYISYIWEESTAHADKPESTAMTIQGGVSRGCMGNVVFPHDSLYYLQNGVKLSWVGNAQYSYLFIRKIGGLQDRYELTENKSYFNFHEVNSGKGVIEPGTWYQWTICSDEIPADNQPWVTFQVMTAEKENAYFDEKRQLQAEMKDYPADMQAKLLREFNDHHRIAE